MEGFEMTAWGREILVLWRRVAGKFEYGDWKVQGPVHGEYAVTDVRRSAGRYRTTRNRVSDDRRG